MADSAGWASLDLPRESMSRHLVACEEGHTAIVEYEGDDAAAARAGARLQSGGGREVAARRAAAPAAEDARMDRPVERRGFRLRAALAAGADRRDGDGRRRWRSTTAGSSIAACSRRGARRCSKSAIASPATSTTRWRRGSARSSCSCRPRSGPAAPNLPPALTRSLETAVDLARTHLVEARRSVAALRPQSGEREDVAAALVRMVDLVRRTSDVPVELVIDDLPPFEAGRRARDRRHRAGGADQRHPPRARPPHRRSRRRRARRRVSACRLPTMAAA